MFLVDDGGMLRALSDTKEMSNNIKQSQENVWGFWGKKLG
jgi:hypothetical protein